MKRKIPYGVINWENLVNECYFVDNTGYIRETETSSLTRDVIGGLFALGRMACRG